MQTIATKQFVSALALKSITEEGRFAGYASIFDIVDNQQDMILRGAFAKSLREKGAGIRLLWQHQMDEPIGIFDRIFEDDRGLYVEGRLLLGVQRAKEAYQLMKAGALEGLSIGYKPVSYDFDPKSGVRRLREVDLFEVSLVTFPANQAAGVTVVKSASKTGSALPTAQVLALTESIERAMAILRG